MGVYDAACIEIHAHDPTRPGAAVGIECGRDTDNGINSNDGPSRLAVREHLSAMGEPFWPYVDVHARPLS